MGLRILVVSDIHGREDFTGIVLRKIEEMNAGLLVVCGDITHFGRPTGFARKFMDSVPIKALAIPGNCDPPSEVIGDIERSRGTNLHGKKVDINGIPFVGFGGAMLSVHSLPFEMPDDEIYRGLDGIMVGKAVLVTHCPAAGHLDQPEPGTSLGSEAVARIVEKYRPVLALSGHIHEARGIEREGGTVFVNPGPGKDGHAAFVEIRDDGGISAELV
jgi:hypothetical protein